MNLTSVDPPEVIRFVKKHYPEVELIKPGKSIYQCAVERGILPTMRVRWCCAEYKENAGAGKVTLIGIRHAESTRRAKRNEVEISDRKFSGDLEALDVYREEQKSKRILKESKKKGVNITNADEEQTLGCISGKESLLISPIIHWTEKDVWEFLNHVMQVPHCILYDQGWHRIGCIGCPMSSRKQKMIENERYPHVKHNWIKSIMAIRMGGAQKEQLPKGYMDGNGNGGTGEGSTARTRFKEGYVWWNIPDNLTPLPSQGRRLRMDSASRPRTLGGGANQKRTNRGLWAGFSVCSSSDGLNDEQERETAENIYDWWISGMSYKKWYAEKFLQLNLFN